jgi:hypothetical protein
MGKSFSVVKRYLQIGNGVETAYVEQSSRIGVAASPNDKGRHAASSRPY